MDDTVDILTFWLAQLSRLMLKHVEGENSSSFCPFPSLLCQGLLFSQDTRRRDPMSSIRELGLSIKVTYSSRATYSPFGWQVRKTFRSENS